MTTLIATDALSWQTKLANLREWMRQRDAVLIAVSGGIDSTFLWQVAHSEIGGRALAVTAVSASLASWERDQLGALAAEIGGRHRTVETGELENPNYVANPANRCYFCKDTLWTALRHIARAERIDHILDGYNLDDVGDYRPGQVAGREHGISSPLKICGFRKADIRAAAESLGLSIWAKPAMACLSSRFAYGVGISAEGLAQVDAANVGCANSASLNCVCAYTPTSSCASRFHSTTCRPSSLIANSSSHSARGSGSFTSVSISPA
jgi:uncharacterized protein